MTRSFLSAEWTNLAMLNYAVDPALLERHVPPGVELDAFDGKTLVSLVGFEFKRTRVLGCAIPFHQDFEEVNLRFYVRRRDAGVNKRGVVFIKELVPRRAIAAVARIIYNENYSCVPMSRRITADSAEYCWGRGPGPCAIRVETEGEALLPEDGSLSQFITEHYWGYARRRGGSLEYEVQHPRWRVRRAKLATFSGDAARYYGADLAGMLLRSPDSAFLAEGSAVTVYTLSLIHI